MVSASSALSSFFCYMELDEYERMVKTLPTAPGMSYDIMYRDASRPGKKLEPAKTD